jgi:SAM-dependent methyltransferase
MPYADLTRNDANPIKRFLHRRRLKDALPLVALDGCQTIVDFGAGDGETCKRLAGLLPQARIYCYEPCHTLRQEAIATLRDTPHVTIAGAIGELPVAQCDLLLCMEVFEHLPRAQIEESLDVIDSLLRPGGFALIGVPLEIFLPALVKGVFRMTRRWSQFDARPTNILRAAIGRPPRARPQSEIAPGLPYHFHHLGFDHRVLRRQLESRFAIQRVVGSPVPWLGAALNSEIYFVARKPGSRQPLVNPQAAVSHFPSGVRPSRYRQFLMNAIRSAICC